MTKYSKNVNPIKQSPSRAQTQKSSETDRTGQISVQLLKTLKKKNNKTATGASPLRNKLIMRNPPVHPFHTALWMKESEFWNIAKAGR